MEHVLLGLAAPAVAGTASNLVERTLTSVSEPFATVMGALAEAFSSEDTQTPTVDNTDWQANLATRMASTLEVAGIDLSVPLELRISSTDGQLEVVGEHRQKALIEAALADDPDLARMFTELAETQPEGAIAKFAIEDDDRATLAFR